MLKAVTTGVSYWQYHTLRAGSRSFAAAASEGSSAADAVVNGIIVLPMPSLSPSMKSGTIGRWLKAEGDECGMYDVVLEVQTESLVEDAYKVDEFAGKVTLLVEAQEEAHLAKLLAKEGQEVPVGEPIAVLCEDVEQLPAAAKQGEQLAQRVKNVYDVDQLGGSVRTLVWQSYLKEGGKQSGCGCH
eukprot:GHRR01018669.1.p1 GENE.GHRR01018669.1~~GHRR01018669.1.p1  ORF type:complete len:186 (+),score=37.20 GHRR01018669.1:157-714(+)